MRLVVYIFFSLAAICLVLPGDIYAQDSTQVITIKKRPPKKNFAEIFSGTISVAPHYSSEMGLGIAMSYTCAKPIAIIGNITTEGYMLLGVNGSGTTRKGNTITAHSTTIPHHISGDWGMMRQT